MPSLLGGLHRSASRGSCNYKAAAVSGVAEIKLDLDMESFETKQQKILENTQEIRKSFEKDVGVLGHVEKLKAVVMSTEGCSESRAVRVLNSISHMKDDIIEKLEYGHKQQKVANCDFENSLVATTGALGITIEKGNKCIIHGQKHILDTLVSAIDSKSTKERGELHDMATLLKLVTEKINEYHASLRGELQHNTQVLTNACQSTDAGHLELCKVAEKLEIVKKTNGDCYSDLKAVIGRLDSIDQKAKHRHDDLCRIRTELSDAIGELGSKMDVPRDQALLGKLDMLFNLVEDLQSAHGQGLKKLEKQVCDTEWKLTSQIDQHDKMVHKIERNHTAILDRLNEIEERNNTRIEDVLEQITKQNKATMQDALDEFTERNQELTHSHTKANNETLIALVSQVIIDNSSKNHDLQLEIRKRVIETERVITAFTGERNKQVERECETYAKSLHKALENLEKTRKKLADVQKENEDIKDIANQLSNITSKNEIAIRSAGDTTETASSHLTMQQMQICESYSWLGRSVGFKKEKLHEIFTSVKKIDHNGCLYGEGDAVLGKVTLHFESTDLEHIMEDETQVADIFEIFSRARSAKADSDAEELWGTFFSFSNKAGCHVNEKGHILTSKGHVIGRLDLDTPLEPFGHRRTDSGLTVVGDGEGPNVKDISTAARALTVLSD